MKVTILQSLGVNSKDIAAFRAKVLSKNYQVEIFDTLPESEDDAINRSKDSEVILLVNYPLSSKIISACPKLQMISVAFTGYDHVDLVECKKRNIIVCNTPGYATNSVAELTFGLIFSVLRNIIPCNEIVRKGGTRQGLIGNELHGKTFGIIGTGAIGMQVATIAKAFGCNLLGYNRTEKPEGAALGLKYVDLKTLVSQSDVISVHTPLSSQTKNLIDKTEFDLMKSSAIVIQTSRGGTINEDAFADALNSGKIAGAGIDVFVQEPPLNQDNSLLKAKNTVLTPHVAFATKEALSRRANIAFANILLWIDGSVQNKVS